MNLMHQAAKRGENCTNHQYSHQPTITSRNNNISALYGQAKLTQTECLRRGLVLVQHGLTFACTQLFYFLCVAFAAAQLYFFFYFIFKCVCVLQLIGTPPISSAQTTSHRRHRQFEHCPSAYNISF